MESNKIEEKNEEQKQSSILFPKMNLEINHKRMKNGRSENTDMVLSEGTRPQILSCGITYTQSDDDRGRARELLGWPSGRFSRVRRGKSYSINELFPR